MKKLLAALAVSAALSLSSGAADVHAGEQEWESYAINNYGDGTADWFWKVTEKLDSDEALDFGTDTLTWYVTQKWVKVGKDFWIPIDPDPDDPDPYKDKPPGHKDGNPLVLGKGKDFDPNLIKWTPELENSLGGGFAIQGKGSRDDLINPDPDGSSGSVGKKPKTQPIGGLDPNEIGQKLGAMEELLQDQLPGLDLALSNVGYIQLHNPAESQSQGGGSGGGGGSAATAVAGAGKLQAGGPPSMKAAALQALVNPDPLASNLATPQGNQGMGLPGGLDQPGGGGGNMQPPGAGAGTGPGGGSGLNGSGDGSSSGSGHTGSTSQPLADAAKRRSETFAKRRKALVAAAKAKRKRQAAARKAVKARRRASYAARKTATATARRAADTRKAVWAKRKRATTKRYAQPKRRIAVVSKSRKTLSNSSRMKVIRLR